MTIDIRERARSARSGSKMMHGGYTDAPALSAAQRGGLDLLFDTLIPVEDGWPPAAELGVADTVAMYLVPDEQAVELYPRFHSDEFLSMVEELMAPIAGADLDARVTHVASFEIEHPELFARVRDFLYYAYYGSPAVVAQIRRLTRFGGDYRGALQPHGYIDGLEAWGERGSARRGAFIPTHAVMRAPQAGGTRA